MDVEWSDADRQIIDRARAFAAASLATRPSPAGFDTAAWSACAREGIQALALPADWQGAGRSISVTAAAFEALGRGGADRGLLFALGAHLFGCALPMVEHATPEQRARYAPRVSDGGIVLALAMTEREGGTSPERWATRVAREGADYVLTGEKVYVSNAPVADLFLVLASEVPNVGALGLTALLVPREAPGLRVEPLEPTLGLRGSPMGRVAFADCRLPASAVLGAPRAGLGVFRSCMRFERTCILAGALGAAARDLAACVTRARARRGRQGPILAHQAVSHRLARMHCRLEAARSVLYRAAGAIDRGAAAPHDPAVVKLTVSEAVVACALDAAQLFAGAGWLDESGIGSALTDAVGLLSASGTSDAQLNTIAAALPEIYR